jgi:glycosyltransferase involved in cell wall biosynthesis
LGRCGSHHAGLFKHHTKGRSSALAIANTDARYDRSFANDESDLGQIAITGTGKFVKITHLLPHLDNDGNGVVNAVVDLACTQSALGHQVSCIGSKSGSYSDLLSRCGVSSHTLGRSGTKQVLNLKRLHSLLKSLRPQIVHAHTVPTALMAWALKPILRFRLITSVHNGPRFKNILLNVGHRIICVSAAVAEQMKTLGAEREKIAIVRNGTLGSLRRPPTSQVSQGPLISRPAIVTLGGLHSCKGMQDLISAFAIAQRTIPNLALYILGKGPMRSRLEKQASLVKPRGGIHLVGFVADPRSYLSQADVFVLSSHREAFGLALAEAREAGCAVVGTNVGGIPEVLELGRCGILVSPNKPTELSDVIVDLLADENLRKTWQKRALENLSWLRVERVCEETLAVYNEALLANPNPNRDTSAKWTTPALP